MYVGMHIIIRAKYHVRRDEIPPPHRYKPETNDTSSPFNIYGVIKLGVTALRTSNKTQIMCFGKNARRDTFVGVRSTERAGCRGVRVQVVWLGIHCGTRTKDDLDALMPKTRNRNVEYPYCEIVVLFEQQFQTCWRKETRRITVFLFFFGLSYVTTKPF